MRKSAAPNKKRLPDGPKRADDRAAIAGVIARYAGNKGAVIPVLQEVQAALGWLSPGTLAAVAGGLGIPVSQIYGVATFYTQFRLKPVGRHLVRVCHGTACHVSGAEKISEALRSSMGAGDGETTADGKFTVESVACLGCCSLAPVMMIDSETFGRLTPDSAAKAVKEF
jgi:NADH-quinone oxidoreductase subunit E